MSATAQPLTALERANRMLGHAKAACERGSLSDAIDFIHESRRILETEQQFRDAAKARA
jgi:hypothetical protein